MENDEKNEGISVNQPEPVERAIEDDFEILDICDAQEDDTTEWTEIQNAIVATGKEENIMEIDRQEEVGNTDRREVAGEKEKKEGVNHVDFFESGRRPKPCKLEFLGDRSVKIDNEEVALSKLRYATRRQYKGFPQRAAHCIIVSYVAPTDTGEAVVKHRFLEMPDVNGTMNLEQDFKVLLIRKFQEMLDLDQTNLDCLETVNEQPLIFKTSDLIIRDVNDRRNSIYDGRCLVVMDIECLSIYPVIDKGMKEPHRLMFWKEEGNNSVKKIWPYSKEKIVFETPTTAFELPVISNIMEQLDELGPKEKGLLHALDGCWLTPFSALHGRWWIRNKNLTIQERQMPRYKIFYNHLLCQWLTTSQRSKKKPSSASASLYPDIHQAHNVQARRRPDRECFCKTLRISPTDIHQAHNVQARRRPDREWKRPADRGTEVWEYHQRQIQITIVRELTTELNNAAASFATNEDMQMYWITVEEDLRLIIESGCVQETDPYSGGLDPDNGDHLKRALNDVADQLSEQQLELAVSRIQAARWMFSGSRNPEIWHIFQADDMELLRKLYFRSLVK